MGRSRLPCVLTPNGRAIFLESIAGKREGSDENRKIALVLAAVMAGVQPCGPHS